MSDLEPFYPDRMASRILGMGDVLTLIEKAEEAVSREEAEKLEKKFRENSFTFEDYLSQLENMKKMGGLKNIIGMLPGMGALKNVDIDEKQLQKNKAIIQSMTPKERLYPDTIKSSNRQRIAKGSGSYVPIISINFPSLALLWSATTTLYVGAFFAPALVSLITTAII